MKTKSKVINVFGFVFVFVIGLLIGLALEYPKVDNSSVSGTISKINNYRSSQISTSDIQLQNEFIADTAKLRKFQNYLTFSYLTVVRTSGIIQFAVKEANAIEKFKTSNQSQIIALNNYEQYLSSARTDLLLSISAFQNPEKTEPIIIKDLINKVENITAQISYRNRTILDFMETLTSFAEANKTGDIQGLRTSYDLLAMNELSTAIMSHDKALFESFNKKPILTDEKALKLVDQQIVNSIMLQDLDKLGRLFDAEKLGLKNAEKLGQFDVQKLGDAIISDSERLGLSVFDAEKLGIINDSEMLNRCVSCYIN